MIILKDLIILNPDQPIGIFYFRSLPNYNYV